MSKGLRRPESTIKNGTHEYRDENNLNQIGCYDNLCSNQTLQSMADTNED